MTVPGASGGGKEKARSARKGTRQMSRGSHWGEGRRGANKPAEKRDQVQNRASHFLFWSARARTPHRLWNPPRVLFLLVRRRVLRRVAPHRPGVSMKLRKRARLSWRLSLSWRRSVENEGRRRRGRFSGVVSRSRNDFDGSARKRLLESRDDASLNEIFAPRGWRF